MPSVVQKEEIYIFQAATLLGNMAFTLQIKTKALQQRNPIKSKTHNMQRNSY